MEIDQTNTFLIPGDLTCPRSLCMAPVASSVLTQWWCSGIGGKVSLVDISHWGTALIVL